MFSKVILIATEGSASVVLKISQAISSMIHHFNVILEWIKNFEIDRVLFLSVGFSTRVTFGKHLRR